MAAAVEELQTRELDGPEGKDLVAIGHCTVGTTEAWCNRKGQQVEAVTSGKMLVSAEAKLAVVLRRTTWIATNLATGWDY